MLTSGSQLGPYEILSPIGAGGMGEVYKARDPRLDRIVAIKVSTAQFSDRFEREARAVAALNHPHICQIYDVGPNYLVMEFIDGAPLGGPLPAGKTLEYAAQICDALDAAHRRGIVHRDLKPDNILVTKAGVKLLDFGLAKRQASTTLDDRTVTQALTTEGSILGTLQYMSPEQLQGKEADARSDIFSFGLVLYEMIAGKRAFEGESAASVIADVIHKEPRPLAEQQPLTPAGLDRVVRTCLAKDPENRWQTARDVKHALDWAASDTPQAATEPPGKSRGLLAWGVAGLLAIAVPMVWWMRPQPDLRAVELDVTPPEGVSFGAVRVGDHRFAVSPDGRKIVFVAYGKDGTGRLYLRSLDSSAATPLPGSESASAPFWAPDSRWLGFAANGKLQKIDVTGGAPQVVCGECSAVAGTWSRNSVIVFEQRGKPVQQVSAAGGTPSLVIPKEESEKNPDQRDPQFLPDGRHFLFIAFGQKNGVRIGSLDGKPTRFVMEQNSSPGFYVPAAVSGPGFLLFLRQSQLMAQPFDPGKAEFRGEARPVATPLANGPSFGASENGVLLFRRSRGAAAQLAWLDREGKPAGTVSEPGTFSSPRLSPDGKTLAVTRNESGNTDIWLYDLARGSATRFTFEPGVDLYPVWSPDGQRIAYYSNRGGERLLIVRPATGIGKENILHKGRAFPDSWSRDGRWLVLVRGPTPISLLPTSGGAQVPFQQSSFDDREGQISPDGRWMLFSSDQSGRREVFVQSLPEAAGGPAGGGKWQISTAGGYQPTWRADGKEIFFLSGDGKLLAVSVESGPATFKAGIPEPLFQTRLEAESTSRNYDVSSDGKRFLLVQPTDAAGSSSPLTVVLNWQALLKR